MLLYYIRHAEPIYNPDSITEFGKKQAKSLGKRLFEEGIEEIYASSCNRAVQTALPACKLLGLKCNKLDFAREDKVWEDMSLSFNGEHANWCFEYPDIVKMFLDPEVVKLGDSWYDHPMFKGYKFKDGLKRVDREVDLFFKELGYIHDRSKKEYIVEKSNDKRIAFVAHSGFGMAFFSSVLDIPYNLFSAHHKQMGTTHISLIEFKEEDGRCIPRLVSYSDGAHLYKDKILK
ncbi:MAG: histidine phosphatase family protein [Bacilli bacterium]|nr:histidine phosphatase family protein [Bacilli bacterium]